MTKQRQLSSSMFCLIRVLQLSKIFVSVLRTSSAQNCVNGSYQQLLFPRNEIESNNITYETTSDRMNASRCAQCIAFCLSCRLQNMTTVTCDECSAGYTTTDNGLKCTPRQNSDDGSTSIIIIIAAVVGGLLVVAGVVVLIVCLIRNERWRPKCLGKHPLPPRLPDPERLNAGSYNKKDNQQQQQQQQSGSGRTGERYTKEPGSTPPRVQSVQYDGIELQSQRSTYINISGAAIIFAETKRNEEEKRENEDEDEEEGPIYSNDDGGGGGGDLYVNHGAIATAAAVDRSLHGDPPRGGGAARDRKGPGPTTRPKPQTKQITTGGGGGGREVTVKGNRESVFPPDDAASEQVYSNMEDSTEEEDDENYVNVIPPKGRR